MVIGRPATGTRKMREMIRAMLSCTAMPANMKA